MLLSVRHGNSCGRNRHLSLHHHEEIPCIRSNSPTLFNNLIVPRSLRFVIGLIGLVTLLISIFLFLQPDLMIRVWPWTLTPLPARVIGRLLAPTGLGEGCIALDVRLSAVGIALH